MPIFNISYNLFSPRPFWAHARDALQISKHFMACGSCRRRYFPAQREIFENYMLCVACGSCHRCFFPGRMGSRVRAPLPADAARVNRGFRRPRGRTTGGGRTAQDRSRTPGDPRQGSADCLACCCPTQITSAHHLIAVALRHYVPSVFPVALLFPMGTPWVLARDAPYIPYCPSITPWRVR